MKSVFLMAVSALAFLAGCSTMSSSRDGTISVRMDSVSHQILGKGSSVDAVVVSTEVPTSSLGCVTWGLNGANYSSPLSGMSSSEKVVLDCPALLAAGTYPLTASVAGVTAVGTLRVVDLGAVYSEIAEFAAPVIKSGFATGTFFILKNNPELVDTFQVSSNAASTILCAAEPTSEGFKQAILVAYPDMDEGSAELIAQVLESAYDTANATYKAKTGSDSNLSLAVVWGNSDYAGATNKLILAVNEGVASGISAYKASVEQ